MYCTQCGSALAQPANFCTRCGSQVARQTVVDASMSTGSKFWQRLKQAVVMQLQVEAAKAVIQQQQHSGDNFWSSATARGNDNGTSGYVDVGGTIVGYDR
jgi:hypothetical protein